MVRLPKRSDNGIGAFALVGGVLIGALLMAVVVSRSTTKTVIAGGGTLEKVTPGTGAYGVTGGTDETLAPGGGVGLVSTSRAVDGRPAI